MSLNLWKDKKTCEAKNFSHKKHKCCRIRPKNLRLCSKELKYKKNQQNMTSFGSQDSMDKERTESYDREYIKTAILKHEEIFRHQVRELHRLYQIQKILMGSYITAESTRQKHKRRNLGNQGNSCELKAKGNVEESNGNEIDESEIELTLGPPIYNRIQRTQKPAFSGRSISSSSTRPSWIIKNAMMGRNYERISGVDSSETEMGLRNEQDINLKQPPWLFQALTLKLT